MIKFIELNTVHFVSANGITLNVENPRVEATDENIDKLKLYIEKNYLKIVTQEEIKNFEPQEEIVIPKNINEMSDIPVNVERIVYTEEMLKDLNKKELIEIASELGVEIKNNMKVSEIRESISKVL